MEIFRSLGALIEPPRPDLAALADLLELGPLPPEAEYTDLFLFQLYPYASVYLGPEGMLGGEARDRIAGFWRALDQAPPAEPDHLTVMLAFYAELCDHEARDVAHSERWRQARKAYLWEHLLSWLPAYLAKLDAIAPAFYRNWSTLLLEALASETTKVGPQDRLPLHLRSAPAIADPRDEGLDTFLGSLLSPARSGVLWVRDDLSRAARELELGSRIGERRYVLKALLGQDSTAILKWLADDSSAWAERLGGREEAWGPVLQHWTARAHTTSKFLTELSQTSKLGD